MNKEDLHFYLMVLTRLILPFRMKGSSSGDREYDRGWNDCLNVIKKKRTQLLEKIDQEAQ